LASKNLELVETPLDFAIELSLLKIPQVYSDMEEGEAQNIKKLDYEIVKYSAKSEKVLLNLSSFFQDRK
jgi:hypothetical protein